MSKVKLTDYVVEFLQKKGIHDFFGYQGNHDRTSGRSIEKNPHVRSHSSYHEQGAAFAACGYAQAKNACGCAYATSVRELPICFPVWQMRISILFR